MRLDAYSGYFYLIQIGFRYNFRLERRSTDVLIVKCYINTVIADLCGQIGHITAAVAIVATIDRRFARPLDGHAQATLASTTCIDPKFGRSSHNAAQQSGPSGVHLARIAAGQAVQPKRAGLDRCTAKTNTKQVLAQLGGREINEKPFGRWNNVRFDARTRRTGDHNGQIGFGQSIGDDSKLLQRIDRRRCYNKFCYFS
jgi:hypothetical protein